jgi:hypothetical protein
VGDWTRTDLLLCSASASLVLCLVCVRVCVCAVLWADKQLYEAGIRVTELSKRLSMSLRDPLMDHSLR